MKEGIGQKSSKSGWIKNLTRNLTKKRGIYRGFILSGQERE